MIKDSVKIVQEVIQANPRISTISISYDANVLVYFFVHLKSGGYKIGHTVDNLNAAIADAQVVKYKQHWGTI